MSGCHQRSRPVAALSHSEMLHLTDGLLEAFTGPWTEREPAALHECYNVNKLVEGEPSFPSIGQVKADLKRLNPTKATVSNGVPAWLPKSLCRACSCYIRYHLREYSAV